MKLLEHQFHTCCEKGKAAMVAVCEECAATEDILRSDNNYDFAERVAIMMADGHLSEEAAIYHATTRQREREFEKLQKERAEHER